MNLVDAHVRQSMLDYYSIFPTRNHVLAHLFLTIGNGYEWVPRKEDGLYVLKCGGEKRKRTSIERPVLERRDHNLPGLVESHELELLTIKWVEKHLHVLCTRAYVPMWPFPKPYPACGGHARITIGQHPPVEEIHPHWRAAVREFAADCMVYIRQQACWSDNDDQVLKRARPDLFEPWIVCKYASEAFMTEADRIERTERQALADRIIDEILKEEKDAKARS